MATYSVITITPFETIPADPLPDFDLRNGEPWSVRVVDGTAVARLTGNARWGVWENVRPWAEGFTSEHPGVSVELWESWDTSDAHEPGEARTVWRDGARVLHEMKEARLVPSNLDELIASVRELFGTDGGEWAGTLVPGDVVAAPVIALLDALDDRATSPNTDPNIREEN